MRKKKRQYWLSWSGFKTYEECPKKYRLKKVDKEKPPQPDSKHNAVVGHVVQRVYEDFYNDELWRMGKDASAKLLELTPKYFYEFLENEHVDFGHISCRVKPLELLETCQEIVPTVLSGIKRDGLLGPYAKSEIKLRAHLQSNYFLFGIADFIIRRPNGELLIVDGKASKHREKYVDERQLIFYALCFKLIHNKMPDRVGYYYYRFADDKEKAFDWIVPAPAEVEELRQDLVAAFTDIQKKVFGATPSGDSCKYCPWETTCTERQKEKAIRREKRRWNRAERGEETLPSLSQFNTGSAMVGFGGKFKKIDDE